MIKEIQSEIWYVLILWIIITWGIMILDFDQRLKSHAFCQSWEYNLEAPVPDGTDRAIFSEPKYKPKYRMKHKI